MVLALVGCAPRAGWQRTDRRTCAPAEPPRVCVDGDPDRQLVVRGGGAALVPGECMAAPRGRGGRLGLIAEDGRAGTTTTRRVGVRRGQVTTVALVDERRGQALTATRSACPRE